MKKLLLGAGALLAFTACTDGDKTCDSGEVCDSDSGAVVESDSACDETIVAIDSITADCDSTDWWYDVYSTGWMSSPDLWIYQTGSSNPWDEGPHPFPAESYDYGANGCWDNYYLQLAITTDWESVEYGSTTLYECSTDRKASLTWHLVVYDGSGAEADCAVWGDDPSSLGTGCADWS